MTKPRKQVGDQVSGRLPESVRQALIQAAATGEPGSLDRRAAIDRAARDARLHHPGHFREEVLYANRGS